MSRRAAIACTIFCVLVAALSIVASCRVRAACEDNGGRYLCESRLSCACYKGCTP